jgi:hypothetical protein
MKRSTEWFFHFWVSPWFGLCHFKVSFGCFTSVLPVKNSQNVVSRGCSKQVILGFKHLKSPMLQWFYHWQSTSTNRRCPAPVTSKSRLLAVILLCFFKVQGLLPGKGYPLEYEARLCLMNFWMFFVYPLFSQTPSWLWNELCFPKIHVLKL